MVSESHRQGQLIRSSASSVARVMFDRGAVAGALADKATRDRLRQVVRPNSFTKTLRKAGVALILAPDPFTAVPGAVMLGASFAARGREPLSAASVVNETRKILNEIGSFI